MIDQKLEYIHLNPVAAGFVDVPEAWVYSRARDYACLAKGLIDLVYIARSRLQGDKGPEMKVASNV